MHIYSGNNGNIPVYFQSCPGNSFSVKLLVCPTLKLRRKGVSHNTLYLKVDNHFVLPIANPFLLCPDV